MSKLLEFVVLATRIFHEYIIDLYNFAIICCYQSISGQFISIPPENLNGALAWDGLDH